MSRLSDLPDPYAIVVMLPHTSGHPASTHQVNGRVARFIAWLLDHRDKIEAYRSGNARLDFGARGFQATLTETFEYETVRPSAGAGNRTDLEKEPPRD